MRESLVRAQSSTGIFHCSDWSCSTRWTQKSSILKIIPRHFIHLQPRNLASSSVYHIPSIVIGRKRRRRWGWNLGRPLRASIAREHAPTGPASDSTQNRLRRASQASTFMVLQIDGTQLSTEKRKHGSKLIRKSSKSYLGFVHSVGGSSEVPSFAKGGLTQPASQPGKEVFLFAVLCLC